jgi:hypothetical protein
MKEQPLTRDMAEVVESLRRTLEAKKEKEAATPEPRKSRSLTQICVTHRALKGHI